MYKLFLSLFFVASLNAEIAEGVAIVVKGSAITLYDIKKEMKTSKLDAKAASDILIRKKLEELEIIERKISASSSEVYDDIKQAAARNNMNVNQFYEAIRNSNGLSSSELKVKIKEKLLSQKLYSAIAYSSISQPDDSEIEEYYKLHKDSFVHPSSYKVTIYHSQDRARLQEKIDNPMFHSPDIQSEEQILPYDKISPELASLLGKTPLNSFTQVVPDGSSGFISFYLKEVDSSKDGGFESYRNQIINMIMAEQREQVLGDYFARLRHSADIKVIRMPE